MKRTLDVGIALAGLIALSPLLTLLALLVSIEDLSSPLFLGERVGRGGTKFRMLKFRTMRPDAWMSGVNSTAGDDGRVTRIGKWLRRGKLDELPQLINVLRGEMSLVGPRPQVPSEVDLYTEEERELLTVRPGMTDLASIVFADEGEILAGSADPDLLYRLIIRPWKSRLALIGVRNSSPKDAKDAKIVCFAASASLREMLFDIRVLALTGVALVSRRRALAGVEGILERYGSDDLLRDIARRATPLVPYPPPGAEEIATHA